MFNDCFDSLPFAAIIIGKVLCMHGGISPELQNLDQIRDISRPTGKKLSQSQCQGVLLTALVIIDIPDSGLLCDLLWARPEKNTVGWQESDRGVSFEFGEDVVAQFLQRHDLQSLCRACYVGEEGYQYFAGEQLVTIFSVPNYCGEFANNGVMMLIESDLTRSFHVLSTETRKK